MNLAALTLVLWVPWSFLVYLLANAWSVRTTGDGPAQLLAVATAALPEGRREWGRAMSAELAHVHGAAARWRFAAGCARVAITPARTDRVDTATVAAVASCAAVAAYFLGRVPDVSPSARAALAAVLGGCLALALVTPPMLVAGREVRAIATGAAALLALGLVFVSRVALDGVAPYLLLAPPALLCAAAALAARRSLRAGLQAAAWATLLGSLTVFTAGLVESLAGDTEAPYSAAANFGELVSCLVVLPLWWAPFALIGAVVAARRPAAPASGPPARTAAASPPRASRRPGSRA